MRRKLFYLSVALLAFGIGWCFVLLQMNKQPDVHVLVTEKVEKTEKSSKIAQIEKVKYECEEKELELLWEKLDKAEFLKYMKVRLKEQYIKHPDVFEMEWQSLNKNFNCKQFDRFELKDLNNDGKDEIFVRGDNFSLRGDKDLFIFTEREDKFRIILFAFTGREIETTKIKYNGFPQIKVKSEYFNGGGRRIETFRFDGIQYKLMKCNLEYEWETDVRGNVISHTKPLIEPCD